MRLKMNVFFRKLWIVGVAVAMISSVQAAQLSERGKATAEIVLPVAPMNWREQISVAEMSKLLRDITGDEFKIFPIGKESVGKTHIYCQQAALDKLGIQLPLNEQELLIKVTPDAVFIAGGTRDGFVNAVYYFMEQCIGVRWWNPGEKYVPVSSDLTLPDYFIRKNPDFILRSSQNMESLDAFGFDYNKVRKADGSTEKFSNYRDRSRPESHNIVPYYFNDIAFKELFDFLKREGHSTPFCQNKDDFSQHPEWFAETAGKRSVEAKDICYSSSAAAEVLAERIMSKIELDRRESRTSNMPPPFIYSLGRWDNAGWCQCKNCTAAIREKGYSGLLIQFLNLVAIKLKDKYPDILLSTLAYQNTADAPVGVVPAANLAIVYCFEKRNMARPLIDASNERTLRELRQWGKITTNLFVWDYAQSCASYRGSGYYDFLNPSILHYADDYRLLKQIGVNGVFVQLPPGEFTDLWSLKNWMLSKVFFDTSFDNEMLLTSFLSGYFGPAWQGLRDYIQCLAEADKRRPSNIWFYADLCDYQYLDIQFFQAAQAAYDRAESLAGTAQPFLDRVKASRFNLYRALLYRYPILMREWRLAGHQIKDFPFDYNSILTETREQFASIAKINACGRAIPRTEWNERWIVNPMDEILQELPDGFATIAVADYPAGKYYYEVNLPVVLERDMAGKAVCRMSQKDSPLPFEWSYKPRWGAAQWEYKENSVVTGRLEDNKIKRGWQWYKLGTYKFEGTSTGLQFFRGKLKLWVDVIGSYDTWANLCFDDETITLSRIILVSPGSVPAIEGKAIKEL